MTNKTWTVTLNGRTQVYEQDLDVVDGKVALQGSSMCYELPVFLQGIEKMRGMGGVIVEGTRAKGKQY